MSEPRALVEHFFRHDFGRLGAVLTRSLGVRRLALVEDVVQAALVQALGASRRRRCTPSTARSPKLTCTARKPASSAWPPFFRKAFPPVIPVGRR